MNTNARKIGLAATILSFLAILLAALGAHLINMNGLDEVWGTASSIHMFNAAALLGITALLAQRELNSLNWGAWLIVMGTVVFSGSIYLHVVSGYKIPVVTPVGGLIMMAGWALAIMAFLRKS